MAKAHQGACTCPLCCPDKWELNAMMAARRQWPLQTATGAVFNSSSLEDRVLYLEAKVDRLEAIIRASDNG